MIRDLGWTHDPTAFRQFLFAAAFETSSCAQRLIKWMQDSVGKATGPWAEANSYENSQLVTSIAVLVFAEPECLRCKAS